MTYVGIDPGLTGAIALINDRSSIMMFDMPLVGRTQMELAMKKKQEVDIRALVDIFQHIILSPTIKEVHVVVEQQFVMPNQSIVATGKYMRNYGTLLGIMNALKIPYSEVEPNVWKKAMIWRRTTLQSKPKKSEIKATSIEQALAMFPGSDAHINKASHHNRAEALLLAGYCRKNLLMLRARERK